MELYSHWYERSVIGIKKVDVLDPHYNSKSNIRGFVLARWDKTYIRWFKYPQKGRRNKRLKMLLRAVTG